MTHNSTVRELMALGIPTNVAVKLHDKFVDEDDDTGDSSVIATGSTTARTLAARFAERFNIKDFGAVGGGVTDNAAAFNAAFAAVSLAGGGTVYIPAGDYKVACIGASSSSGTLTLPTVPFRLVGDGMDASRIIMDNGGTLFYRSSGAAVLDGVEFADFSVLGPWGGVGPAAANHADTLLMNDGGYYPFLLGKLEHVRFTRVGVDYSRTMSIALRRCTYYTIDSCRIRWSARDCISTGTCNHGTIINNTIDHGGDDGIACHSADAFTPVRQTVTIANNRLFDTAGIHVLGAIKADITGNVLDLCWGHGIDCSFSGTEGNSAILAVNISDNVITDMVNVIAIGGALNQLQYITVQPHGASTGGTLTAAPGSNDTATGAVTSPYAYNYNTASSGSPLSGGDGIIISNNVCMRTRAVGSTWVSFGFGSKFLKTGWTTPTLSAAEIQTGTGIQIGSSTSTIRNTAVRGNKVKGISTSFSASVTSTDNLIFENNDAEDFLTYAFSLPTSGDHSIILDGNRINGDPYLASPNRHAVTKGAWQNTTTPGGVNYGTATGIEIVRNRFKNISTVENGSGARVRDNLIYCDFNAAGYSATNLGVGNLPSAGEHYWYAYQISDTTVSTWKKVSNFCVHEASAIPSSGKYAVGMHVRNSAPAVAAGKVLIGWARLTTGTAHVSGTDWSPLYCTVS